MPRYAFTQGDLPWGPLVALMEAAEEGCLAIEKLAEVWTPDGQT